jgi:protein SCO1/2
LNEASSNRIGSPVDNILTYCYHYDPQTNKHSLIVARVVQLGGLVTLFTLGGFMLVMFRRDSRADDGTTDGNGASKANRTNGTSGTGTKVNG